MTDNAKYYKATKTQKPLEPIDLAKSQRKNVDNEFVKSTNGSIPSLEWIIQNS